MNRHLQYAHILLGQKRWSEAEKHLRGVLAEAPARADAMALLAICQANQARHEEAVGTAREAVGLAPDAPFCHWALARTLQEAGRAKEAREAIMEAIRLDPDDADFYAVLGSACIRLRHWDEGLRAVERGLDIEPDHVQCANLRTVILVQLGRRDEARQTVDAALRREPDNAASHANKGWTLLHSGDPKKAMDHFREALRLDPDMEWARLGIIEALKARHAVYRVCLRYFLWMSRLSPRAQWGIIIGLFVGARIVRSVGHSHPGARPFTTPVLLLYALFVYMSWVSDTMFNLLLRLNPIGKYALTPTERYRANATAACLLVALVAVVSGAVLGSPAAFLGGVMSLAYVIPVSGTMGLAPGRTRWLMGLYTAALAVVGAVSLVAPMPLAGNLTVAFFLGVLGYSIVRNMVATHE